MNEPQSSSSPTGKLRIFLGYAPGVGKSYAMLEAAQRRHQEGADIIIAQFQANCTPEVAALLDELPFVPPHNGAQLDVEAVIKRRPFIAIIDELAATNPPGSRHAKRYQEVEELLKAGINIYTTLNVQHIESLNDVVREITAVTITETIPDSFLDQADQIELIDILPEDLMERVQQGQVIIPSNLNIDPQLFFRRGNLTALRELALRQVARRVDEQMRTYMQDRAIEGPWATEQRLLVCLSPSPMSVSLVRTGCRLAQEMNASWHAVYVSHPTQTLSNSDQARLNETMRLAESLGATVVTITGESVADTLLNFARYNNMTQIIIGRPLRSRWQELLSGSIVNRLIRLSGKIDVHVISGHAETAPRRTATTTPPPKVPHYLQALAILFLTTLAASAVNTVIALNPANLVMFFLLAVVVVAQRLGYGPAVMTAVVGVVTFNFFFIPPQLTFRVANPEYLITFLGLLVAGVVIANLTARARQQTEAAQRRERETAQLYALTRELSATVDPQAITQAIVSHSQQTFHCEACLFVPQDGQLTAQVQTADYALTPHELDAANWVFQNGRPAGQDTDILPTATARYLPLKTAQRTLGILSLRLNEPTPLVQQRLMDAFATQAAIALEAAQLGEEARQTQILREKEKLQSALLSSISHDLRTPLVSITGTLSSLRENDSYFDADSRRELLDGAYSEADRLNRLVSNLLDMTRLEAQSLTLKRELYDLQEVIGVARSQLRHRLLGRNLLIDLPPDLPLVPLDLVLFAQVIVNLLDNAVKYSPAEKPIAITAHQQDDSLIIEIADRGMGVLEEDLPHIFEKFYRGGGGNGRSGSGLGLSICQGIVESHNGTITAQNRQEGGTCFIIQLPLHPNS
ncbi:MAG: sensor histidine kinase KdpD [Ardenticatenaceae bacterium]|nr:sensor histidine kinase KdpD [Ardenticatenaceae bacterium]